MANTAQIEFTAKNSTNAVIKAIQQDVANLSTIAAQMAAQMSTALDQVTASLQRNQKETKTSEQRYNEFLAKGEVVTDRLAQSFETLSVRSTAAILKEQKEAVAAYDKIRNSGVASADEIARAKNAMKTAVSRTNRELKSLGATAASSNSQVFSLGGSVSALAGKFLILELAVRQVSRLVDTLFFDFNATLETAGLGIATSYMTAGQYIDDATGKALEGQAALRAAQNDAAAMTEKLQVANFQTLATLDQLIRAYQETLPVAMAQGFNRDQVEAFTTAMVQAAGAIGVNLNMLGEETRSILTGAIDPKTSRVATVLGLRNEDIAEVKANGGDLFDYLMDKLAAYQIAGIESQKTWEGLWSNTADIFKQVTGRIGKPVFEQIKIDLAALAKDVFKLNEETGTLEWNPGFVETAAQLGDMFERSYDILKRLIALGTSDEAQWLGKIALRAAEGAVLVAETMVSGTPQTVPSPSAFVDLGTAEEQKRQKSNTGITYVQNDSGTDEEAVAKAEKAAKDRASALKRYELELTAMQGDEIATRLAQVDAWVEQQRALLEKAGLSAAEIDQRMADTYAAAEQKKTAITTEAAEKRAAALAEFEAQITDLTGSELEQRLAATDRWLKEQLDLLEQAGLSAAEFEQRSVDATRAAEAEKNRIRRESAAEAAQIRAAARENEINASLSEVDRSERTGGMGEEEALTRRLELYSQLRDVQQETLNEMDRATDADAWYAQLDALNATRDALVELQEQMQELNGTFEEGFSGAINDWTDNVATAFEAGEAMANSTAESMQGAFEQLLFDAQRGELDSLGDYWDQFAQGIQRTFAQLASQQIVVAILKALGVTQKENLSTTTGEVAATTSLTAAMTAQVAVTGKLTAAYWALAAAKAAAGAMGGGSSAGSAAGSAAASSTTTVVAHTGGLILHGGGEVYVPRFHIGGLASDEVPAILQTRERVLSREQNKTFDRMAAWLNSGASNNGTNVTIIESENAGAMVNYDDDGNIEVQVEEFERRLTRRAGRGTGVARFFDARYGRRG